MTHPSQVRVVVDAPQHADLVGPLTYASESELAPGTLVRAPLGRREVAGVVAPKGFERALVLA